MPTCGSEPRTPTQSAPPSTTHALEFTSPPERVELDADHEDDVPLRFRRLENFLESTTVLGLADRAYTEELMVAVGDEPMSAEEAKGIK
jgi:hypothetical protein